MNILSIVHRAIIVALILPFTAVFANAQNPSLEFTTDSRVAANGPTLNSGAFTFYGNSDNPTGTTYAPYSPALTVTFSIDNPQATTGAGIPAATGSPVNFGYLGTGGPTGNNAIIARMSLVGVPQDIYYTSSGAPTGTGMAAASAYTTTQSNYVVTVNQSTAYLDTLGTPLTDMPYQADLTITFNRPVNNPILHISGMGELPQVVGSQPDMN